MLQPPARRLPTHGIGIDAGRRKDPPLGWYRAVHVKSLEMPKLRTLLANRKLVKRKLVDMENHIRDALRTYGLLVGQVSRGKFEARVRELLAHSDYVFETMIGTMLEVRRGVLGGYDQLHKILRRCVLGGWLVPRHATTRVGRRIGQSLMHGERAMKHFTMTYVAMDTHKSTISLAIAEVGRRGVRFIGEIPSRPEAVAKMVDRLYPQPILLLPPPRNERVDQPS